MLQIHPYLSFNGQCDEAFKFYEKCLGGTIVFSMTYGTAPGHENMPPELTNRIMHVTLKVGDQILQGADSPGEYQKAQGMTVALALNDPAEAERIFAALEDKGAVGMPLQETFWALRFGAVTDRFGTPWMINCEKPAS